MENVLKKYGDYDVLFRKLLKLSDKDIDIVNFDCVKGELPYDRDYKKYDGFIISGSRYSCYEDIEWIHNLKSKIVEMDKLNIRMVGICFGHQLIMYALGGEVKPNKNGWEVSVSDIFTTDRGYDILCQNNKRRYSINQMHKDIVSKLPENFEELFYNSNSRNQGCIKNNILTFQGHPEYNPFVINEFLENRRDIIGTEIVENGLQNINKKTDTDFFSRIIYKFLNVSDV